MKNSRKFLVLGLTLALILFAGVVLAAKTITTTKSVAKSTTTTLTAMVKVKLTQDDVTRIVLRVYKNAQILDVKLIGKIYSVRIRTTAKSYRILSVGGNTGKILKNAADTVPVNQGTTSRVNTTLKK